MSGRHGPRPARGFSLVELVIVCAIILAVAAIAIPQATTALQVFKLRGTASSLSGVVQKCRMQAVARNGFYSVAAVNSGATLFVDADASGTINQAEENSTVLQLPARLVIDTTGGHPSDSTLTGGLTAIDSVLPRFNPRGLPCFGAPGACAVNSARIYITYLRQDRALGLTGWAAVTVTPAGRVRVFTWDGSNWQ
jgi:prepilin-type N-terminal cleavage/methylation domain-containing protein